MRQIKNVFIQIITFIILFLFTTTALAHKAIIRAEVENGIVKVECVYSGDTPMINAKFQVFNDKDEIVSEGRTDDKGKYQFNVPDNVKILKLVVHDLMGHRAQIMLLEKVFKK